MVFEALGDDNDAITSFLDAVDLCRASGAEKFPRPNGVPEQIAEEIREFRESARLAPEHLDVWENWSSCMRDSGYEFASRSSVVESLNTTASVLLDQATRLRLDAADQATEVSLPASLLDQIDDLVGLEQQLVNADVTCSADLDLDAELMRVQYAQEEAFLAENGERIALVMLEQE